MAPEAAKASVPTSSRIRNSCSIGRHRASCRTISIKAEAAAVGRHLPQGAHVHAAGGDGEVRPQQADLPAVQGLLHELPASPPPPPGRSGPGTPGGSREESSISGVRVMPLRRKVLLQEHPPAGSSRSSRIRGNSAISCRVLRVVEVAAVAAARHKDGVGGEAGPGVSARRGPCGEEAKAMSTAPDFSMLSTLALRPLTIFSRMPGCWRWKASRYGVRKKLVTVSLAPMVSVPSSSCWAWDSLSSPCGQQAQGAADVLVERRLLAPPRSGRRPGDSGRTAGPGAPSPAA